MNFQIFSDNFGFHFLWLPSKSLYLLSSNSRFERQNCLLSFLPQNNLDISESSLLQLLFQLLMKYRTYFIINTYLSHFLIILINKFSLILEQTFQFHRIVSKDFSLPLFLKQCLIALCIRQHFYILYLNHLCLFFLII